MGHPRQHTLAEKVRSPYLWHRWVGLVLAVLLVWVAVTGMLLNHEDDLGLGARPVQSAWLLDAWGVPEPVLGRAHRTRLGWVVAVDAEAWFAGTPLPGGPLVGALDGADWTLLATRDLLHLYSAHGELIERFPPDLSPVTALGWSADRRPVIAARGALMVGDTTLSSWRLVPMDTLAWTPVAGARLSDAEAAALRAAARARGLTWERVVRDLHAGHVPTRALRWLLDLIAIGLIALALTGVWIHRQRRGH